MKEFDQSQLLVARKVLAREFEKLDLDKTDATGFVAAMLCAVSELYDDVSNGELEAVFLAILNARDLHYESVKTIQ